jgi:hypothetical protein
MTLEELIAARATRKEYGDLPLQMTRDEANAYLAKTELLDRRIGHARGARSTLADLTPKLEPHVKWRDLLVQWRENFCQQLLALPRHDRDRATQERRQALLLAVANVDRGAMVWPNGAYMLGAPLAEAIAAARYEAPAERPGPYWGGSLPEVKKRIDDLQRRIDAARAQLDEALLDDAARAARDAASAERAAAARALPVRKTRADGTQYDKYPDGRRVEVTS